MSSLMEVWRVITGCDFERRPLKDSVSVLLNQIGSVGFV